MRFSKKLSIIPIVLIALLCACNAPPSEAPTAPVSSAPVSSAPASSEPVSSEPASSAPASSAPVSSAPVSSAPVSSEPVSSAPVSSEPVSSEPVSSEPTDFQTTQNNTTLAIEDDIFAMVNELRVSLGLSAYSQNNSLKASAFIRSKEMKENNYFEHSRPDGRDFNTAMDEVGYTSLPVSENIGKLSGISDDKMATKLFEGWKASQSHYDAMVSSEYTQIGIALYGDSTGNTYATQHFGV